MINKKPLIALLVGLVYFNGCSKKEDTNVETTIPMKICEYGEYNDVVLLYTNTNGNPIVAIGYTIEDIISGRKFVASEFQEGSDKGEISMRVYPEDRLGRYFVSATKLNQIYSFAVRNGKETNCARPDLTLRIN